MFDTNISKLSALDPPGLALVARDMDHHLLQFSDEEQGYHEQDQQGVDLLHSALLTMSSYTDQTLADSPHGMVMPAHDRSSTEALITTPTHPHHPLYNIHMSTGRSLQILPPQPLHQLSACPLQQSSPTTPQAPHHGYLHHSALSPSSPQALSSTPRQPPVLLRPMPSSSPGDLEFGHPQPHSQSNSPEQSPPGSRSDRLGRLGSHGGVGRKIILASGSSVTAGVSVPNGVSITGAVGQNHTTKDSSGKFPCPHCNKSYLHLKHLKRHLLRHTGDRPYQCVLCKDTFSRSDILKRHFQKCSIRRGNPGNLTHLAHAHDHQRKKPKNVREQGAASPTETTSEPYSPSDTLIEDSTILVARGGGNPKRSTRACSQCVGFKLLCDGNTPCAGCSRIGADCIYLGDDLGRQSSGKGESLSSFGFLQATDDSSGMDTQELFNFPPPTHPHTHTHIQLHSQNMQAYQQPSMAVRISPPYTPITESAYTSMGDTQGLNAVGFGDGHSFHHHQVRLQHKINSPQEDVLKIQSEANSLAISQSDQPLVYFPTSAVSQSPPNHPQDLDWAFPDSSGYYNPLSPIHTQPSNNYNYASSPLTATPISLMDGGIADWGVSMPLDPFQAKCEHLQNLLFSDFYSRLSTPESPSSSNGECGLSGDLDLKEWIVPHHIGHFVESFRTNFQTHFPAIHLPTFQFSSAYDGLALAIICHGAVYSDRGISVEQVRRLMERSLTIIDQDEPKGCNGDSSGRFISSDEMQARSLFAALSAWHGSERQRDRIRRNFPKLINIAKNSCYFRPLTPQEAGLHGWSYYHQTSKPRKPAPEWNWMAWVEQEYRNRIMFGIFLLDAAFAIYFNERPHIGLFDLKLTLPADDAVWEATTSEECFNLLGLNEVEASAGNITGTSRAKQPEISAQLGEILTIGREFRIGTTNAYGKFILMHAIHVYIWQKQREFGLGQWSIAPNTEPNQRVTTQQKNLEILHFNQTVAQALDKWKKAWDADLITQFGNKRRSGFCRDGIAFYWLAVFFTRQKKRDLLVKDVRDRQVVAQVQQMLETVNQKPRSAYTLQEPGAVSGIDKKYGIDELAFDIKLLLAPIEKDSDTDER